MQDKLLQIRVDKDFLSSVAYLQKINGYKSIAETVKKTVLKEYRKESDYREELNALEKKVAQAELFIAIHKKAIAGEEGKQSEKG